MSGPSTSASTYLKYLPAIYRSPQEEVSEPPFVFGYLKIFEKLLSGIDDQAGGSNSPAQAGPWTRRKGIRELLDPHVISTLFHPRLDFLFADDASVADTFTPLLSLGSSSLTGDNLAKLGLLATYIGAADTASVKQWLSNFLDWIAATFALDVDQRWGIDTKRFVIAQAFPLFRSRGTTDGMTWLLNAWFGLDPDAPMRLAPDGGMNVWKISVSNPGFPPIHVCESIEDDSLQLVDNRDESTAKLPDIVCFETGEPTAERAVGYQAWYFVVTIHVVATESPPSADAQAALANFERAVREVVDEFKPALTEYSTDIWILRAHPQPPPPPPPPPVEIPDSDTRADRAR